MEAVVETTTPMDVDEAVETAATEVAAETGEESTIVESIATEEISAVELVADPHPAEVRVAFLSKCGHCLKVGRSPPEIGQTLIFGFCRDAHRVPVRCHDEFLGLAQRRHR